MGKIIVYECDLCSYTTKNADEIFICDGSIKSGENEFIYTFNKNNMICFECLIGIFQKDIGEISIDENNQINENEIDILEQNNIRELIEPTDVIQKPFNPPKLDIFDKKENIESKTQIINEIIEDKENISKVINSEKNQNNLEKPIDYFQVEKIVTDEDELTLVNDCGFTSLDDFYQSTNIKTLKGIFVPLINDGISESSLDNPLTVTHEMVGVPILYKFDENKKPLIKNATAFIKGDSGFISHDIFYQLVG